MVSGGASAIESDLATGTPAPSRARAAGQFWTFTMSNSKASTFAETMSFGVEPRMHVTLTRTASGDARQHDHHPAHMRVRWRTTRARRWRKPLFSELFRAIWPLLPVWRRGSGPPPVSPVFSNPIRVASIVIGIRHSPRTCRCNRPTNNSVGRWRRGARRYVCLCGASVSSSCR